MLVDWSRTSCGLDEVGAHIGGAHITRSCGRHLGSESGLQQEPAKSLGPQPYSKEIILETTMRVNLEVDSSPAEPPDENMVLQDLEQRT